MISMRARHGYVGALRNAHCVYGLWALRPRAPAPSSRDGQTSLPKAPAVGVSGRRRSEALVFALTLVFASFAPARPTSAALPPARIRQMERLIDALASRNDAPRLVGKEGSAFPIFAEKFDWNDQKRVQAAAWALAQDDSNDLWGCLVEHLRDKRYSATCEIGDDYPCNYDVGTICLFIARSKLRCAYLRHLEPGKTFHYGGNSWNWVSNVTRDFIPGIVQRDLHHGSRVYDPDDLAEWYRARKGKPLYELQMEMCEWAVKKVEDAPGVAEKPRKTFIAAVRNEIESLRKAKRPVVDHSPWASPMSDNWKFYSKETARWWGDSAPNYDQKRDQNQKR